jgi:hypothetical protein
VIDGDPVRGLIVHGHVQDPRAGVECQPVGALETGELAGHHVGDGVDQRGVVAAQRALRGMRTSLAICLDRYMHLRIWEGRKQL